MDHKQRQRDACLNMLVHRGIASPAAGCDEEAADSRCYFPLCAVDVCLGREYDTPLLKAIYRIVDKVSTLSPLTRQNPIRHSPGPIKTEAHPTCPNPPPKNPTTQPCGSAIVDRESAHPPDEHSACPPAARPPATMNRMGTCAAAKPAPLPLFPHTQESYLDWGLSSDFESVHGAQERGGHHVRNRREVIPHAGLEGAPPPPGGIDLDPPRLMKLGLGGGALGSEGYGEATMGSVHRIGVALQHLRQLVLRDLFPDGWGLLWDLGPWSSFLDVGSGYGKVRSGRYSVLFPRPLALRHTPLTALTQDQFYLLFPAFPTHICTMAAHAPKRRLPQRNLFPPTPK
jgi:hypothetical protein